MSFSYNELHMSIFGLRVHSEISINSPRRDMEIVRIPGRDGPLMIDNGRYDSVVVQIPCRLDVPDGYSMREILMELHNWLIADQSWHQFQWDDDPDFLYRAMAHEPQQTLRRLERLGETALTFRMHPIKFHRPSLTERQITNNHEIVNPTGIPAKPTFRIVGNGNITLNIGSQRLELVGIVNGITVDSEDMTVVMANGQTAFAHMRSMSFPTLEPGRNAITWTGNFQVFLTPRLGALI